jgi:hypothetical protein
MPVHGEGLAQHVRGEPSSHDGGVRFAAHLGDDGCGEHREGGDLDAARGARAAAADEHQHAKPLQ